MAARMIEEEEAGGIYMREEGLSERGSREEASVENSPHSSEKSRDTGTSSSSNSSGDWDNGMPPPPPPPQHFEASQFVRTVLETVPESPEVAESSSRSEGSSWSLAAERSSDSGSHVRAGKQGASSTDDSSSLAEFERLEREAAESTTGPSSDVFLARRRRLSSGELEDDKREDDSARTFPAHGTAYRRLSRETPKEDSSLGEFEQLELEIEQEELMLEEEAARVVSVIDEQQDSFGHHLGDDEGGSSQCLAPSSVSGSRDELQSVTSGDESLATTVVWRGGLDALTPDSLVDVDSLHEGSITEDAPSDSVQTDSLMVVEADSLQSSMHDDLLDSLSMDERGDQEVDSLQCSFHEELPREDAPLPGEAEVQPRLSSSTDSPDSQPSQILIFQEVADMPSEAEPGSELNSKDAMLDSAMHSMHSQWSEGMSSSMPPSQSSDLVVSQSSASLASSQSDQGIADALPLSHDLSDYSLATPPAEEVTTPTQEERSFLPDRPESILLRPVPDSCPLPSVHSCSPHSDRPPSCSSPESSFSHHSDDCYCSPYRTGQHPSAARTEGPGATAKSLEPEFEPDSEELDDAAAMAAAGGTAQSARITLRRQTQTTTTRGSDGTETVRVTGSATVERSGPIPAELEAPLQHTIEEFMREPGQEE